MSDSNILLSTGQKIRSFLTGSQGHVPTVIPTTPRIIASQIFASTFRVAGLTSSAHNISYLVNLAGSPVLMAVRRYTIHFEAIGIITAITTTAQTFKVTSSLPTGGTPSSTKYQHDDDGNLSDAHCCMFGAASVEGTASTITWTAPVGATPAWRQFCMQLQTATGRVLHTDNDLGEDSPLIPRLCVTDPIILRPGEALVTQMNVGQATTTSYNCNAVWDEFVY